MERSGFFDAYLVGNEYDRVYLAEHFAKYFASFIGNGVFGGKSDELHVTVTDPLSRRVAVQSGQAYINGYWYENEAELPLSLDVADGVLHRKDSIVLRWSSIDRDIKLDVKRGTPSHAPEAPSVTRNNETYELLLAVVSVPAGATTITDVDIEDTRLDAEVCGLVQGVVQQFDTTAFGTQLQTFINNYIATSNDRYGQFDEHLETAEQSADQTLSDYEAHVVTQTDTVDTKLNQFDTYKTDKEAAILGKQNMFNTFADTKVNEVDAYKTAREAEILSKKNTFYDYVDDESTAVLNKKTVFIQDVDDLLVLCQNAYSAYLQSVADLKDQGQQAYDDFLVWLNSVKLDATDDIQDLLDELNQLIDGDTVGILTDALNKRVYMAKVSKSISAEGWYRLFEIAGSDGVVFPHVLSIYHEYGYALPAIAVVDIVLTNTPTAFYVDFGLRSIGVSGSSTAQLKFDKIRVVKSEGSKIYYDCFISGTSANYYYADLHHSGRREVNTHNFAIAPEITSNDRVVEYSLIDNYGKSSDKAYGKALDVEAKLNESLVSYQLAVHQGTTQNQLNALLNNFSANYGSRTKYNLVVSVNQWLTLDAGQWYVEGFKVSANQEWQIAKRSKGLEPGDGQKIMYRSKNAGAWSDWKDIIQPLDDLEQSIADLQGDVEALEAKETYEGSFSGDLNGVGFKDIDVHGTGGIELDVSKANAFSLVLGGNAGRTLWISNNKPNRVYEIWIKLDRRGGSLAALSFNIDMSWENDDVLNLGENESALVKLVSSNGGLTWVASYTKGEELEIGASAKVITQDDLTLSPTSSRYVYTGQSGANDRRHLVIPKYLNGSEVKSTAGWFSAVYGPSSLYELYSRADGITNMQYMFENAYVDTRFVQLNTSNVLYMDSMFSRATLPEVCDLDWIAGENLKTGHAMFEHTEGVKEINLNNFSPETTTDLRSMFYASKVEHVRMPNLGSGSQTTKALYISTMFSYCRELLSVDFGETTFSVMYNAINNMFEDCSKIETIDLSNMRATTYQSGGSWTSAFAGCSELTTLDVSGFDTDYIQSANYMFEGCDALTTCYVKSEKDGNFFRNQLGTPSTINFIVKP